MNRNKCGYFGSETNGGFADYTVVHWENIHPVESRMTDVELATFATSSMTAESMLSRANVGPDDSVLITGCIRRSRQCRDTTGESTRSANDRVGK